jgi:hypothetical protein
MKAGGIAEPSGNDQDAPLTERPKGRSGPRSSIVRRIVGRNRAGGPVVTMTEGRRQFMFTALENLAAMMRMSGSQSSAVNQCGR